MQCKTDIELPRLQTTNKKICGTFIYITMGKLHNNGGKNHKKTSHRVAKVSSEIHNTS